MKTSLFKYLLVPLCLMFLSTQCEDDDTPLTQEDEAWILGGLYATIDALARTSVCNDTFECKFIGFGSKPCGGPWKYLVYSTSIDTQKLEELVEDYNQKESEFNIKWNIASDCALAQKPTSFNCENNTCVAVY